MLFLLFQLGQERYALPYHRVVEVLPRVQCKVIPQAPPGVAGLINYHGKPVPLLDLGAWAMGQPAEELLSTRIILVHLPGDTAMAAAETEAQGGEADTGTALQGPERQLLGLVAEKATSLRQLDEEQFQPGGVSVDGAPYLGPVYPDGGGLIQWIDVEQLLPEAVRRLLYRREEEGAPWS